MFKKAPFGITLIIATTMAFQASAANAGCLDDLRNGVLDLKDNFITAINNELANNGSSADNTKAAPLLTTVNTACGTIFEALQSKNNFVKGCLNGMFEANVAFNTQGLLDMNIWNAHATTWREINRSGTCLTQHRKNDNI